MALLAPVIVLAVLIFIAFRYWQWRSERFDKRAVYQLGTRYGHNVYIFHVEPSLEDMAKIEDELKLATLELEGQVFAVDNYTNVAVLEDDGGSAVKVKIFDAQTREQVGWVRRDNVVRASKVLPQ